MPVIIRCRVVFPLGEFPEGDERGNVVSDLAAIAVRSDAPSEDAEALDELMVQLLKARIAEEGADVSVVGDRDDGTPAELALIEAYPKEGDEGPEGERLGYVSALNWFEAEPDRVTVLATLTSTADVRTEYAMTALLRCIGDTVEAAREDYPKDEVHDRQFARILAAFPSTPD